MNLDSLHILLTYQCNYECDHCFVWGSPWQSGSFTSAKLEDVFQQAVALDSLKEIYFEGGEPFLYYPLLVWAVKKATDLGFATGIVSNGYWAQSFEDALVWLQPLAEAGLSRIEISSDVFHTGLLPREHEVFARTAAEQLGVLASSISIDPPTGYRSPEPSSLGEAISGGGVMYRGRAAVQLTAGLPTQAWSTFDSCPYEDLVEPGRIHLDPLGYLHICQGIVIGNLFEQPLAEIVRRYDPHQHPVVGPILKGGPAQLVREFDLSHKAAYVDACHLCYSARAQLQPELPAILAPEQMYGVINS